MVGIKVIIGDNFPKDCGECPLFKEYIYSNSCAMGGEFTEKEIKKIEDGDLDMYYHGYLDGKRPKNCPLIEMR